MSVEERFRKDSLRRLLIFTLVTIFIWIAFDVYRILNKNDAFKLKQELVQPLNPSLDLKTAEELKERISLTQEEISEIPESRKMKFEEASPSAMPETE